jgi:hypothetical protein
MLTKIESWEVLKTVYFRTSQLSILVSRLSLNEIME